MNFCSVDDLHLEDACGDLTVGVCGRLGWLRVRDARGRLLVFSDHMSWLAAALLEPDLRVTGARGARLHVQDGDEFVTMAVIDGSSERQVLLDNVQADMLRAWARTVLDAGVPAAV